MLASLALGAFAGGFGGEAEAAVEDAAGWLFRGVGVQSSSLAVASYLSSIVTILLRQLTIGESSCLTWPWIEFSALLESIERFLSRTHFLIAIHDILKIVNPIEAKAWKTISKVLMHRALPASDDFWLSSLTSVFAVILINFDAVGKVVLLIYNYLVVVLCWSFGCHLRLLHAFGIVIALSSAGHEAIDVTKDLADNLRVVIARGIQNGCLSQLHFMLLHWVIDKLLSSLTSLTTRFQHLLLYFSLSHCNISATFLGVHRISLNLGH